MSHIVIGCRHGISILIIGDVTIIQRQAITKVVSIIDTFLSPIREGR